MATISVASRFNGPTESGNGGYTAGLLAAEVEGPAAVSLRSPVPLDRPLELVREDGAVRALDGETMIAEAEPAEALALEVPAAVSIAQAHAAERLYAAPHESPFSQCFVCGPARADCMEVFAGAVEGREGLVATTWTPPAWSAGPGGEVRPEFVWAALDCPTYFAVYGGELVLGFLVRQQVELRAPVAAETEHVIVSWPLAVEGRKRRAGAAVLAAGGDVLALGEALLVEPRQPSPGDG
jgi:hypothetical protein